MHKALFALCPKAHPFFKKQPKRAKKIFTEKSVKLDEKERKNLFTSKRALCKQGSLFLPLFSSKKEKTEENMGKRKKSKAKDE